MSTENVSSEDQPEVSESLEAGLDGPLSAEVVSGQGGQVDAGAPAEDVADADLNEFGFSADEMVTEDDIEEEELVAEASPIEELVEETVVGEVDESEMDWYILKVQVNREKSICDNLRRNVKRAGMEAYFQDILVPTEDVREFTKAGKQRVVKRKLYPGYIVVRMAISDESWFLVRETSGIGDFTGSGGKPAPLSAEEIDRIISTSRPVEDEESEEKIKTAIPFKEGDRVRVKEGYFQNYEGDVSAVDERNGRITVMIDIFGRPNPVELDHWHVESVA